MKKISLWLLMLAGLALWGWQGFAWAEPCDGTDCGSDLYACSDLIDNDGDGFFDVADPDCDGDPGGNSEGLPL